MSLTHQLFLQSLRELVELEPEKFDAHRMPLIAWLVDHAWSTVPAYRTRLAAHVESGSFDLAHWCELPLLRRDDLRRLGAALEARALPPEAKEIDEMPDPAGLVRRRSRLAAVAAECELELALETNGLDLAAPLAILHPDCRVPQQGLGWSITFAQSKWLAGDPDADAGAQLAWLESSGARLLRANAAIAERLADARARSGASLSVEALIVVGADLGPLRRAAIEAGIGKPVVHVIEEPELGIIAASDPRGGYLVPAATCVVEVVDAEGRPVPGGGAGELVVTPLYEYAVPRLRFASGIAAIAEPESATLIGVRRLARAGDLSG
jgi:phenylacetate-CoA ligase